MRMGDETAARTDKKPSAAVAVLLGLTGPLGIGQFYPGQTRRAVLWLTVLLRGPVVSDR